MDDIESVIGDYEAFLGRLVGEMKKAGLNTQEYIMDHLAYRVETMERYEEMKSLLSRFGELVLEEPVRNRPIAIFKFDEPLKYEGFVIDYFELPAPSEHQAYREGLEHVDFITSTGLEEFLAQYPDLKFKTEGISKPTHPEISLKFDGISAKFCNESISEQIRRNREIHV